jgi:penicillin G amidase
LLGVFVVVGIAGFLFLRYQIRKSFPRTSGRLTLSAVQEPVSVVRDEYGVPRIEANNEHDLMVALGYVHAQDRLWQMDMSRRVGEGRLSELLGSVTLPFDKMFRIVGLRRIAGEIEKSISPESRNRLQWYADGVNAFISSHTGKYPVEFDLLRYDPEPWKPVHSVLIAKLMAWELNLSWWTDLTYGEIAERVGLEKALDIFPSYPASVAPMVPAETWQRFAGLGSGFHKTAEAYAAFFGSGGTLGGSNAWVVAPSKSASGKVVLANDTHLQLQNPSKWYEVQLRAPGYAVSGMSVPGVPGVVAGHNDRIAWGLTNVMADDADFYVERINPEDSTKYLYDGAWLPIKVTEEEIRVKGDTLVSLVIRSTHHGPVVSDIETSLKKARYPFVASMRWTGYEINDQIDAFISIDRATAWDEFVAGVKKFSGPGQNFVYGDIDGNIGYWCGVLLPIRGKQQALLPQPGWDKSVEWQGFVPFEKLPHCLNPPEGYIATANNKIVDDTYPYHITDLYEPPSRIIRLREFLGKNERFSVEDFENLQNDKFSNHAKEMMPFILSACKDSALGVPDEQRVFEYLRNWHFLFTKEDIATTIYQEFFIKLVENIFKDEMGEELFHDWVLLVNIPIRVTTKLVEEGTSSWFDDVRTSVVETRDMIIRKSLREAVMSLRQKLGPDSKNWRWGDIHTVTLRHPFGLRKPLDRVFNIGPFSYAGGSTSPSALRSDRSLILPTRKKPGASSPPASQDRCSTSITTTRRNSGSTARIALSSPASRCHPPARLSF